ncbi:DUF2934 domain-containing protein [Rhodoferax sp.]|uniref:DUF2934 domain-containing protein n=1 Tax=Rhodoferax sp. TaxID=50421 RepID=UPI001EBCD0BD|nr:DUF2934 domain-containing protein [Rhodoferax sp.]MBT9504960.1 DUF2934 domain-containing protein [Rhodoferax sp.]
MATQSSTSSAQAGPPQAKVAALVSTDDVEDIALSDDDIEGPSDDQIRQIAYGLYEARNGQTGSALDDWLQAENQLIKQSVEVLGAIEQ